MGAGNTANHSAEALIRVCSDVVQQLVSAHESGKPMNVDKARKVACKRHGYGGMPRLTDIISAIPENHKKLLMPVLKAKPIRSASGIAVVALMSKPHRCPHISLTGNVCVYCPGGPDSDFEYSTQSYTGYEVSQPGRVAAARRLQSTDTPSLSPRRCVRFEHGTTLLSKAEAAYNSCVSLVTRWTR